METLKRELNAVIDLLEAKLPANPRSPENVRLIKEMEPKIADYFRDIEQSFPMTEIENLYNAKVKT